MQFKSLKINETEMHFLIVHGCLLTPPPKLIAPPHAAPPPLKNEAPPSEKQAPPHWNMKDPSMKWFLEKSQ